VAVFAGVKQSRHKAGPDRPDCISPEWAIFGQVDLRSRYIDVTRRSRNEFVGFRSLAIRENIRRKSRLKVACVVKHRMTHSSDLMILVATVAAPIRYA